MTDGTDTFLLLVRLVVSLGLILGMVGIAAWALRRRGVVARAGGAGAVVQVLDRRSLTKSAHVALVQVDGRRYVLGVTDQRVDLLHAPGGPAGHGAGDTPDASAGAPVDLLADVSADSLGAAVRADAASHASAGGTERSTRRHGTPRRGRRTPALHADPAARTATDDTTRRARRTGTSTAAGTTADGTARMGFVDAMRELTVRRS